MAQDSKSTADPLGGMLLTTLIIGAALGSGLTFAFNAGDKQTWQYRAESAEAALLTERARAEQAEAKLQALLIGANLRR